MTEKKLQVALYWGAACGGCDVAVLDTDEFILDIAALADIRLWPIAADGKYRDVEAMKDGELDLCLLSGAIRNSENEHVAKLLRKKSKLMAAFGSCAHMGGTPGLANLTTRDAILSRAYLDNPSIEKGNRTVPKPSAEVPGGTLSIPTFYKRVYKLSDIVEVDYFVPGCPPAPKQVKAVVTAVATGALPPKAGWSAHRIARSATTALAKRERRRSANSIGRGKSSRIRPDASWIRAFSASGPRLAPGAGCAIRTPVRDAAAATDRCRM